MVKKTCHPEHAHESWDRHENRGRGIRADAPTHLGRKPSFEVEVTFRGDLKDGREWSPGAGKNRAHLRKCQKLSLSGACARIV